MSDASQARNQPQAAARGPDCPLPRGEAAATSGRAWGGPGGVDQAHLPAVRSLERVDKYGGNSSDEEQTE